MNSRPTQNNQQTPIYALTAAKAQAKVMQNLGFTSYPQQDSNNSRLTQTKLSIRSIHGEILRTTLWSTSNEGTQPVYITKFLRIACLLAKSGLPIMSNKNTAYSSSDNTLTPNIAVDYHHDKKDGPVLNLLRDTLNELELLGDVTSLPHGYWLPSPLHLVSLPFVHRWILIAGRPFHCLSGAMQTEIEHSGIARFLTGNPNNYGLQQVVQSEEQWCCIPQGTIDTWALRTLHEAKLQPVEDLGTVFEFYAPKTFQSINSQYFRWISDIQTLKDGRYLIRSRSRGQISRYAVAEVVRSKVIATGSISVKNGDVRRLMYGIDALAKCPIRVQITTTNNTWLFLLRSELPRAEYRLFTTLGFLHLPPDGQYYPRKWEILNDYGLQAAKILERLGIQLDGTEEQLRLLREVDL